MRSVLSIFLVFYLVFKPLIPVMDYVVNYDYISNVLCINRDKPELHCNGKCYLSKELAKSSQEDSSKTKNQTQKIIDLYLPAEISEVVIFENNFSGKFSFNYQSDYSYLFLKHVFRPPVI